jgi:hypothetical protein
MLKLILTFAIFATFCVVAAGLEKPETFNEAKELSIKLGKPILLEFVHDD